MFTTADNTLVRLMQRLAMLQRHYPGGDALVPLTEHNGVRNAFTNPPFRVVAGKVHNSSTKGSFHWQRRFDRSLNVRTALINTIAQSGSPQ
jgi:hypothetical protein